MDSIEQIELCKCAKCKVNLKLVRNYTSPNFMGRTKPKLICPECETEFDYEEVCYNDKNLSNT